MPKIAQLTAPRKIEIKDRESLAPGPKEVVIGVEAAGVCGPFTPALKYWRSTRTNSKL